MELMKARMTGSKNFQPFSELPEWKVNERRQQDAANNRLKAAIKERQRIRDLGIMHQHTFTIESDWTGTDRKVTVVVHESVASLRIEAEGSGQPADNFYAMTVREGEKLSIHFVSGIVSLGHVVHEVAHAALDIYNLDMLTEYARAKTHLSLSNETIPYLIANLTEQVVDTLATLGVELHPTHEGASA